MKKYLKILSIFLFLYFCIFNFALANGDTGKEGTRDLSIQLSTALGGTVSGIPEFIERLYNWSLATAGAVAVVMIMVGGFLYLTSAGTGRVDKAKKMIGNAVVGLLLVFSAYLVLNTISPSILKMQLPEIRTIDRKGMEFELSRNSRGLYCSEGASHRFTPASLERQRQQCIDRCGSEDRIAIFELSWDPTWPDEDVYCCGCEGGCPENQISVPETIRTRSDARGWCRINCEDTHQGFELFGGAYPEAGEETTEIIPACCACQHERTDEFREAGSQIACLRQDNPATPDLCNRHSGTDGACAHITQTIFSDAHCEWTPDECAEDSNCAGPNGATGEGHCWGNQCFQTWLSDGEICEDLGGSDRNGACQSGHCEVSWGGYDYCVDDPCGDTGCIGHLKFCTTDEECRGGEVCVEMGQVSVCNYPE